MCNTTCYDFFVDRMSSPPLRGIRAPRVLEVGSRYVDGSVRPLVVSSLAPCEYIGIDIEEGRGVDRVIDLRDAIEEFGANSFDVIVSTEFLEHFQDWRFAIRTFHALLKVDGHLLLSTRSKGFPFHAFPHDYWRFEVDDMHKIFHDWNLIADEPDRLAPGVYVHAVKTLGPPPSDLEGLQVYSMILGCRTARTPAHSELSIHRRILLTVIPSGIRRARTALSYFDI